MRDNRFMLDREQGKLLGVCSGLARQTGIDATIIRVALVVATLAGAWPWSLLAYFAAAFVGFRRAEAAEGEGRLAVDEPGRSRMRDLDRRMAEIESYTASRNSRLAREIEELR